MKYMVFLALSLSLSTGASIQSKWKHLLKVEEIDVYSLEQNEEGIIPFKAQKISKYSPKELAAVLYNYENKSKWAPKLKAVKLHEKLESSSYIFSEYYSTPWPFYDREFLLRGSMEKIGNSYFFKARSSNRSFEDKAHVQAIVDKILVKISPYKKGSKIEFEFIGDMGGAIPSWVSNIIQKKWPVRFIQAMEKQVLKNSKINNL